MARRKKVTGKTASGLNTFLKRKMKSGGAKRSKKLKSRVADGVMKGTKADSSSPSSPASKAEYFAEAIGVGGRVRKKDLEQIKKEASLSHPACTGFHTKNAWIYGESIKAYGVHTFDTFPAMPASEYEMVVGQLKKNNALFLKDIEKLEQENEKLRERLKQKKRRAVNREQKRIP